MRTLAFYGMPYEVHLIRRNGVQVVELLWVNEGSFFGNDGKTLYGFSWGNAYNPDKAITELLNLIGINVKFSNVHRWSFLSQFIFENINGKWYGGRMDKSGGCKNAKEIK